MTTQATLDPRECQAESFKDGSSKMHRLVDLFRRALELYRRNGFRQTLLKIANFASQGSATAVCQPNSQTETRPLSPEEEALNLQPGEVVEVKSVPEILATLDPQGKLRGLAFLPNMQPFCGKRFVVFKRMETLFMEESQKVRKLKNTVLLDRVQCDGLLMRCDRSCYLYWREAWLRRVPASELSLKPLSTVTKSGCGSGQLVQIGR
jgi:hypothetical protein